MGWTRYKIGDILTLEYGKPLDKAIRKEDGLYPAYGANGVKCRSDEYYFDKPTIIVGRKGSAGELTLTEEKFWPLDVTYYIEFDHSKFDLTFLYHLLSLLNLPSYATGVKPGINRNIIYSIDVDIPSPPEQKRIVAILDQAFADIDKARALTEQNLKNVRELFESYLQQVFSQRKEGWVAEPMASHFTIKHGYAFKGEDFTTDFSGSSPVVLTPGNYQENGNLYFTEKNTKRCNTDFPSEFKFTKGDLTIVMTDLSSHMKILGRPAFILDDNTLHNQRIGKFEYLSDDVMPELLYWFLLTGFSIEKIKATATGTMVRHTAPKRILENTIFYPKSKVTQKEICDKLSEVRNKSEDAYGFYLRKLELLDELKKSLLQKAFSGELTKESEAAA